MNLPGQQWFHDTVSALAYSLAGHPKYEITRGSIELDGVNISELDATERARLGMFLAFQYPITIPGVRVADFLRHAITNMRNPNRKEGEGLIGMREFRKELNEQMDQLGMDPEFARRYLNDGFSGGEKKRHEILQMELLKPKIAILDETDSGLDVDALRIVSEGVNRVKESSNSGIMLITHYTRILRYIKPDFVHVFANGRIVEEGGPELADKLEENGYEEYVTK